MSHEIMTNAKWGYSRTKYETAIRRSMHESENPAY